MTNFCKSSSFLMDNLNHVQKCWGILWIGSTAEQAVHRGSNFCMKNQKITGYQKYAKRVCVHT